VPINLTVSQLTKIGTILMQFTLGAKVYAEGPSGAPEWGIRFVVTPLFPTGGKPRRSRVQPKPPQQNDVAMLVYFRFYGPTKAYSTGQGSCRTPNR